MTSSSPDTTRSTSGAETSAAPPLAEASPAGLTREQGHALFDKLSDLDYRVQLRDLGDNGFRVAVGTGDFDAASLIEIGNLAVDSDLGVRIEFGGDLILG